MRVADYLAEKLNSVGIEDVFILTGGGLMFLTDGIACNKILHPYRVFMNRQLLCLLLPMPRFGRGMGVVMLQQVVEERTP